MLDELLFSLSKMLLHLACFVSKHNVLTLCLLLLDMAGPTQPKHLFVPLCAPMGIGSCNFPEGIVACQTLLECKSTSSMNEAPLTKQATWADNKVFHGFKTGKARAHTRHPPTLRQICGFGGTTW